jgi:hypothetical protein
LVQSALGTVVKAKKDPSAITVEQTKDESDERALARIALSPSLHSALTLREYTKACGELDLMSLVEELRHQVGQTIDDDLGRAEAMLTTQAHTLDAIFGNLARRAIHAEYLPQFDTYLKLGLRALSQCRATWESLAAIKNPVGRAYVGQANFAHNQQINNESAPSRTRQKQNPPIELLEKTDGERLDTGAPQEAVTVDSDLETVGEKHRSAIG